MDKSSWKVFKFGGSSLADTECFVRVSRIILDSYYANPDVRHGIVVSAMGGVTDLLINISENYGSSSISKTKEYKTINTRLSSIASDLLEKKDVEEFQAIVSKNFHEIEELMDQPNKGEEKSLQISNIIAGFGELWSAKLLTLYMSKLLDDANEVTFIDSRKVIYLKEGLVGETVDWKKSLKNHKQFVEQKEFVWGLIASLYVANLFSLLINVAFIPLFLWVLKMPFTILAPIIFVLSLVGGYSPTQDMHDVWLMLIFGVGAYLMRKLDYPLAPAVLAIVLGPIAEPALRQSLLISNGDFTVFFTRPISGPIMIIAIILLILPALKPLKNKFLAKEKSKTS